MVSRIATPALLLLLAIGAPTASADTTTKKAQEGLADLRFDDARAIATKGIEEGNRGPKDLGALHMILGQVSASLGEDSEAEASFRAAISLNRAAKLPDGVSPKLSKPFSKAQKSLEGAQPIELLAEVDEDGQLSVQVASDPAELVGGIEASYKLDGDAKTKRAKGTGTIRLELPKGATDIRVALTDTYGNRLLKLAAVDSGEASDAALTTTTDTPSATTASPPLYRRWQLYAGLSIGSLATGAYFGNLSRNKSDEISALEDGTEFSVARNLEDQAKKNALYANIGFAVGAGFGAAAIWMYMSEDSDTEAEPKAAFIPMLGSDRVGVAAHVSF
tara:strand:- start:61510 stop:62508 length:999 start_codon:yes stop_codon:yes gene_type:complete